MGVALLVVMGRGYLNSSLAKTRPNETERAVDPWNEKGCEQQNDKLDLTIEEVIRILLFLSLQSDTDDDNSVLTCSHKR